MDFGIIILIKAICGVLAAAVASHKGRSVVGWFFGGFFLDIIALVIILVIGNKKAEQIFRQHTLQEQRRLREQLRQERIKGEAFRQHTAARLDTHDQTLGVSTRSSRYLSGTQPAGQLQAGPGGPAAGGRVQWYYEVSGQTVGPVSEAQLKQLLASRQLAATTLLWSERLGQWTPASQIPTFGSVINR